MTDDVEICTPAPYYEAAELYREMTRHKDLVRGAVALQLARAVTYGIRIDDRLAVVMGFWPVSKTHEEVFLAGLPADDIRGHLVMLRRLCRLILSFRTENGITDLTAYVREGHRPGQRMARLAGFARVDKPGWKGCERWEMHTPRGVDGGTPDTETHNEPSG